MKNIQVLPIRIDFTIPVNPGLVVNRFAYCYVVWANRVFLIDTGVAGSEGAISSALHKANLDLSDLDAVILTHSHPDHLGSAATIKAQTQAQVWAHSGERAWIEDVNLQNRQRPVPGFEKMVAGSVKIDRLLSDGDTIDLGDDATLAVLHTPGHSAGSIALFSEAEGILFSGDLLPHVGAMPVYEDVLALARSLARVAQIENVRALYSSWADPIIGDAARQAISDGIDYLKTIHRIVLQVDVEMSTPDPMILCRECVTRLGLPPSAAIPLVAHSLAAHRQPAARDSLIGVLS